MIGHVVLVVGGWLWCFIPMQGYLATTIQQYLSDHPVDPSDVVHIEDGGWVNPAGDFGSPQSLQWNFPLLPKVPKGVS